MSYTAIALTGFVVLLGIVAFFILRQGSTSVPSESALVQSERSNTYDTSKSVSYGEETFNYPATWTNYSYGGA
jgi:hypothetical protein